MTRRWLILVPALPLLVVCLGGTRGAAENQAVHPGAAAYLLAAAAALTLLLRRQAPLVGVIAAALLTGAYLLRDEPFGPVLFIGPAWAWCLAAVMPLRRAVPWLVGSLVVVVAAAAPRLIDDAGWGGLLIWATAVAGATAAGAATGFALAARARSEAAARAEVARRAVSEERLAMAQDVHDGVGHTLAVIAMHAGVAAHVIDRDPARAKELLTTLAATCREALDGLRADLDRMRQPAASAARSPGPGLADLPVLLDRMRDGGLRLEVELPRPIPAELPPAVGEAAYRIVQESLTNVLRHAGTAEASVRIRLDGALLVEIADRGAGGAAPADRVTSPERGGGRSRGASRRLSDNHTADPADHTVDPAGGAAGPSADPTGGTAHPSADPTADRAAGSGGSGIAGMVRRAEAVGGSLAAGPRSGGGFLVRAELPARTVPT